MRRFFPYHSGLLHFTTRTFSTVVAEEYGKFITRMINDWYSSHNKNNQNTSVCIFHGSYCYLSPRDAPIIIWKSTGTRIIQIELILYINISLCHSAVKFIKPTFNLGQRQVIHTCKTMKCKYLFRLIKLFMMKWKYFPCYWPFVRGIHRYWWISRTKSSDAELWCFLWSQPE